VALFARAREVKKVGGIIGAASFAMVRLKAEQIIGVQELVKDIVADA
jgi:hypothetical protein